MNEETLLLELQRISCLDNLRCLGCGYEHSCSIHGCAIINEAVQRLETLTKSKVNDPLSLEELREMDGEPVWIHSFSSIQKKPRISGWAIVETVGSANATFVRAGVNCRITKWFTNYGSTWLAYRRKPEEKSL